MKVELPVQEVYNAVEIYMLLKGFTVSDRFQQKYTNAQGLVSISLDIEKHNHDVSKVVTVLKGKGYL